MLDLRAAGLIDHDDMNALMAAPVAERQALRRTLSDGLAAGSAQESAWAQALVAQSACEFAVPCKVGDYTDFYTSVHHATNIGRQFRPDNPLLPNYKWVPIGYHGRASSIIVSGTPVKRPQGQTKAPDAAEPSFGPCKRLDYELEVGAFIGGGNALGEPIAIEKAEDHLFGLVLLNDWSARDVQAWEYQPLGPFLSKNFGSTLSPWIVRRGLDATCMWCAFSSVTTRSTTAWMSSGASLGGGSLASRAYALMKRLSDSDRDAMTARPRCTSSRQSRGGGSRSTIVERLPAIDLIGASELFISWPMTRIKRCHACRSSSRSG